jgi:hypothetical protein
MKDFLIGAVVICGMAGGVALVAGGHPVWGILVFPSMAAIYAGVYRGLRDVKRKYSVMSSIRNPAR